MLFQGELWYKVLVAKYRVEVDYIRGAHSKAAGWVKDLCCIREGVCVCNDRWFMVDVVNKVDNGKIHPFGDP